MALAAAEDQPLVERHFQADGKKQVAKSEQGNGKNQGYQPASSPPLQVGKGKGRYAYEQFGLKERQVPRVSGCHQDRKQKGAEDGGRNQIQPLHYDGGKIAPG